MANKRTTKSTKVTKKSPAKSAAKKSTGYCSAECKDTPAWSRVASQIVDFFKKAYAKVVAFFNR